MRGRSVVAVVPGDLLALIAESLHAVNVGGRRVGWLRELSLRKLQPASQSATNAKRKRTWPRDFATALPFIHDIQHNHAANHAAWAPAGFQLAIVQFDHMRTPLCFAAPAAPANPRRFDSRSPF